MVQESIEITANKLWLHGKAIANHEQVVKELFRVELDRRLLERGVGAQLLKWGFMDKISIPYFKRHHDPPNPQCIVSTLMVLNDIVYTESIQHIFGPASGDALVNLLNQLASLIALHSNSLNLPFRSIVSEFLCNCFSHWQHPEIQHFCQQ
jgi:hypothetical protein